MRGIIAGLWLTALVLGCGTKKNIGPDVDGSNGDGGNTTTPISNQGWQGGSRLKARILEGTDGSKQFLGFFDSERMENCTFARASDGKQHCMPDVDAAQTVYFTDASCTAPLLVMPMTCATPPKYTSTTLYESTCPTPAGIVRRVYLTQAAFQGMTAYIGSQGSCSMVTINPNTQKFFTTSSELPPASFAEATEKLAP